MSSHVIAFAPPCVVEPMRPCRASLLSVRGAWRGALRSSTHWRNTDSSIGPEAVGEAPRETGIHLPHTTGTPFWVLEFPDRTLTGTFKIDRVEFFKLSRTGRAVRLDTHHQFAVWCKVACYLYSETKGSL